MSDIRITLGHLGIMPEGDPAEDFSRFCELSERVDATGYGTLRVQRGIEALRIGDYSMATEDARFALLKDESDVEAWRLLAKATLANLAVTRGVLPAAAGTADLIIDSRELVRTAREAIRAALDAAPQDAMMCACLHILEDLVGHAPVKPFREHVVS